MRKIVRSVNRALALSFFFLCLQDIRWVNPEEKDKTFQRFNTHAILTQLDTKEKLISSIFMDHALEIGMATLYGKSRTEEENGTPIMALMAGAEQLTGKEINSYSDINFKGRLVCVKKLFLRVSEYHDDYGNPRISVISELKFELH